MATQDVLKVLIELGGSASINEIIETGKKRGLPETVTHPLKVRDGLIRLMQMGAVKTKNTENWRDDEWILLRQPSPEELAARKKRWF